MTMMYHPTNKGFFPLLALKMEQSLSIEEKSEFEAKKTLADKIGYVNGLPRLNGDDPSYNMFRSASNIHEQEISKPLQLDGNSRFN